MPYEINLGMPPAGYAVTSTRAGGETVTVQYTEFTSSEDGQHFIRRLEGFPDELITKVSATTPISPSQIDNLLAIIRRDGTATVYVNEVRQIVCMRASRSIEKNSPVTKNDVVDVERLEVGVVIPPECGVLFLFSVGWRKGLFYDFGPIGGPNSQPRTYDCANVFGRWFCHVMFQERFSISDDEWAALLKTKWFPFAALRHETVESLINHVRSDWNPDDMCEQIILEIRAKLPLMLDVWSKHPSFATHIEILSRAIERFQNEDYVSCTSLIYPRIEGILRTHHVSLGVTERPSPKNLTNTAVTSKLGNQKSLLLPHKFGEYLRHVYFADFDQNASLIDVSRHSVAHGVAHSAEFNSKSALLGLLVLHQLFYFLEQPQQGGVNRLDP